jgi:hypothetical protein
MAKATFNKNSLLTTQWDLNLKTKLVKCYIWSVALLVAVNRTLQKVKQRYLDRSCVK